MEKQAEPSLGEDAQGQQSTEVEGKDSVTFWKEKSRLWEDRAKSNKDELDAAKAELASLRDAQDSGKSDLEKALERISALEASNNEKAQALLKNSVATAKGVDPELLVGSTREELEAQADRLLAWKGTNEKKGPVIPWAGSQPAPTPPTDEQEFVRDFFQQS